MSVLTAWEDPGCPIPVEYSREALEQIRSLAVDGLLALPRIGLGVGGLLLGSHEAGKTTILDSVTIPCSHADGPSFHLTAEEREQAIGSIRAAGSLTVVGWYCSKPRGLVTMSERDLTLFGILCPEAWQVTLLIRPSTVETSRAALCFRDAAGVVRRGAEVLVEAFQPETAEPDAEQPNPEQTPAEVPDPRTVLIAKLKAANSVETSEPVAAPADAKPDFTSPMFFRPETARPEISNPPVASSRVRKLDLPPVAEPMIEIPLPDTPQFDVPPAEPLFKFAMQYQPKRRSRMARLNWVLVASALVAGTGAAYFTRHDWMPLPPLHLSAAEVNGHLTIRWNRAAIPGIDRATLTVNDGGDPHTILLDSRKLDSGAVQYDRKSTRVDALLQAGGLTAQVSYPE